MGNAAEQRSARVKLKTTEGQPISEKVGQKKIHLLIKKKKSRDVPVSTWAPNGSKRELPQKIHNHRPAFMH